MPDVGAAGFLATRLDNSRRELPHAGRMWLTTMIGQQAIALAGRAGAAVLAGLGVAIPSRGNEAVGRSVARGHLPAVLPIR
jgi:hypothetical protein